jgi:ribose/xylose/arabinose/galactoside ABC-type transport system permease subunit
MADSILQTPTPSLLQRINWRRYATLIILIGLGVAIHFLTLWKLGRPVFFTQFNIINVIRQVSIVGIMAVGMTYVIMIAEIDLGVGSLLLACGMVAAVVLRSGAGTLLAVVLPLLVGMATGLLVGLFVTRGNVPSFVATLGVLASYRGVALLISGTPLNIPRDSGFRFIGAGVLGDIPLLAQVPLLRVIPVPVVIFALVIAVGAVVFQRYPFGRHVAAVGGNAEAARLAGINVRRIRITVFMISGFCAAISALILTARLSMGSPVAAQNIELDVIAAVVVGGTSLYGGRGSVIGSIIGALLIGVLSNGLTLLQVNVHWQPVVKGLVIVGAVLLDQFGRRNDA